MSSSKSVASQVSSEPVDEVEEAPTMMMEPVQPVGDAPFGSAEGRKVIGARTWAEPVAAEADEVGDEATQVISHLSQEDLLKDDLVIPGAAPSKPQSQGGDEPELLAELKAVINKKFDEIVD